MNLNRQVLIVFSFSGEPNQITFNAGELSIGQKTFFTCSVKNYRPLGNLSLNIDEQFIAHFQNQGQPHNVNNRSYIYTSEGTLNLQTKKNWDGRKFRCCVSFLTYLSQCSADTILRVKGKRFYY